MANVIEIWLKDWDNVYKRIPVNPENIKIESPFEIKTVNIASLGERTIPGERGMKRIAFSSFFPRDYNPSYCEYKGFDSPWTWIEQLEKWRDTRKNIRIIIVGTPISIPVFISNFSYDPEKAGAPGDIYYSIELTECTSIYSAVLERPLESHLSASATNDNSASNVVTHTVVKGESLSLISRKYYGKMTDWPRIYNANKSVVGKNPDLIYPGQKLVIPK